MSYETVASFRNHLEAEVAKSRLEAEGIPVVFAGGGLGPITGFFNPRSNEVRVQVPAEHLDEARMLLETDWSADVDEQWDTER